MLEVCPSDPELPGIIENLLETAMASIKAAQAESNSTQEEEISDTSARMVTIYSDQSYLAKGRSIIRFFRRSGERLKAIA